MENAVQDRVGYRDGELVELGYVIGHVDNNSHVDDNSTAYTPPSVIWLKDGVPTRTTPISTDIANGRVITSIAFTFIVSDAGVYQCVFIDIVRSELLITAPTRLDTGRPNKC